MTKCDYTAERSAILMQIGILIGIMSSSVRWASDKTDRPSLDWGYYVRQFQQVVSWNEHVFAHSSEWIGRPVRIHYPGDPVPTYFST
jgi:hypothetical protein